MAGKVTQIHRQNGIRLRTQYASVNFTIYADGELWLNGDPIGRLFPAEVEAISHAVADAEAAKAEGVAA